MKSDEILKQAFMDLTGKFFEYAKAVDTEHRLAMSKHYDFVKELKWEIEKAQESSSFFEDKSEQLSKQLEWEKQVSESAIRNMEQYKKQYNALVEGVAKAESIKEVRVILEKEVKEVIKEGRGKS